MPRALEPLQDLTPHDGKMPSANGRLTLCQQWATGGIKCNLIRQASAVWAQRWSLQVPGDDVGPITPALTSFGPLMDLSPAIEDFAPGSPRKVVYYAQDRGALSTASRDMDSQKRIETLHELDQVLHDDPPAVYLFEVVAVLAASSTVRGATIPPNVGPTAL